VAVPYSARFVTPATSSACIPGTAPATYGIPTGVTARSAAGRVTVSWPASHASAVEIQEQIYRPSTKTWDAPCTPNVTRGCAVGYVQVGAGVASYTFTGLTNGRFYRFTVSRHNALGWGRPSAWVGAIPKTVPNVPGFRSLTGYSNHVTLLWSMPTSNLNGSTIKGYQVAISRWTGRAYAAWSYKSIGNVLHYSWPGTAPVTRYRVTVRAISNVGDSAFMAAHVVTTARP
jgi:hypothetical protein